MQFHNERILDLAEDFQVGDAVWDFYREKKNVPVGMDFMRAAKDYELRELSKR